MTKKTFIILFTLISCSIIGSAQDTVLYKEIDSTQLYIEIHYPKEMDKSKDYPAIVFFNGGGWSGGTRVQFLHHSEYLSERGLVCFMVDYRTKKSHGTTPFECLKDAKSAMRYVRGHASEFSIDPDKIIAAGGSAGGHLAAACALTDGFNEASDDTTISTIPNALVLFNPVYDNATWEGRMKNRRVDILFWPVVM
jgi:acetyl esterase